MVDLLLLFHFIVLRPPGGIVFLLALNRNIQQHSDNISSFLDSFSNQNSGQWDYSLLSQLQRSTRTIS